MKTKIYLLFFALFFLSTSLVSAALQLDKGSITLELELGEESCTTVTVTSSDALSSINLRDVWAESFDEEGNLNQYILSAQDNEISISYIEALLDIKSQDPIGTEVCISADKIGDFKGALIFTPESDDQIVVEVGTWLLVHVSEKSEENQAPQNEGGSTSSSGSSRKKTTTKSEESQETKEPELEFLSTQTTQPTQQDTPEPQTAETDQEKQSIFTALRMVPVVFIVFLVIASFYVRRKRRSFAVPKSFY